MIKVLVGLHVLFGSIAVIGMIIAWTTKKGGLWHKRGGKAYVVGMAGALILAAVVSIATSNVFLFFVGVFSAYLVFTGVRIAMAKSSVRTGLDKTVSNVVLLTGVLMLAYSAYSLTTDSSMTVVLAVFGCIAIGLAYADIRRGDAWPKGKERIVLHLNRMGAASIATVTAVFVVNVQTNPAWIAWMLPSVVGSFVITHFVKKLRQPKTA